MSFIIDILKRLIGPSIWTSLAGYAAIALVFVTAGGDIIENIIAIVDADPSTIFNREVFAEALEVFGLGSIAGFLGIKAKDNSVSTEDVKAFEAKR